MIESLEYACLIQAALLPQPSLIHKTLHDNFILYLPKDIISGDFYWIILEDIATFYYMKALTDMKNFEKQGFYL